MRRRIVLIGAGPTALTALESLAEEHEVVSLVRRPDSVHDAVVALAVKLSIPVIQDLSPAAIEAALWKLRPDCAVISSYQRIIPPRMLALCPFVNVHYSPLPKYRGRANVNWAVLNGESSTAISIHTVVPGLDAGNLLFQQRVPIGDDSTVADLYTELNGIQRQRLGRTVRAFLDGHAGNPQEGSATYCCSRTPADGEIDWSMPTRRIYNLIRSLQPPYPYAYSFFEGRKLPIARAQPVDAPRYDGRIPGRVVFVDRSAGFVDVLTGDGVLRVHKISGECGDLVPAANVIKSTKDSLGLHSRELLSRIETLEREIRLLTGLLDQRLANQS